MVPLPLRIVAAAFFQLCPPPETPFLKPPGSHRGRSGRYRARYLCNRGASSLGRFPLGKRRGGAAADGDTKGAWAGPGAAVSSCRRGSFALGSPGPTPLGRELQPRRGRRSAGVFAPRDSTVGTGGRERPETMSRLVAPSPTALQRQCRGREEFQREVRREMLFWLLPSHSSSGRALGPRRCSAKS